MEIYSLGTKDINQVIRNYKNKGEQAKVSTSIEYNGNLYREIIFMKKGFINNKAVKGYLYIGEKNKLVEDKSTLRQLIKLGYYLNVFYNEKSNLYIKRALEGSENIKNQKVDCLKISNALDDLKKKGIKGTDEVKEIINKVIELRVENDNEIIKLVSKGEEYINDKGIYGDEIFSQLYSIYKEILMMNFTRIKLINSGIDYYDDIEEKASKQKGVLSIFIGKSKYMPFIKLSNLINNYKKILMTYGKILSQDKDKYEKFLLNVEKGNIDNIMNLIRNK
ncbi:hypothetical protein [Clostridium ganghwense]|uniref:Uncharacterized protein n=1 Tax=Clostridium ganghwense TaxID=312089 RepID=A0ABT4CN84_9CLOT|nr:hypothetical protein [Clostridium ganghwense]MCY6370521.1 hypothetical protein [Clostridium ganghwense]